MPKISLKKMKEFVSPSNLITHIATIQPNGRPYINAVWYEFDGKDFYLVLRARARHAQNIKNNPHVAMYFDLIQTPFTRVIIEGDAKIMYEGPLKESKKALDICNRMAEKYLGPKGPEYAVPTYPYPRALVKVKVVAWHGWETFDWPDFQKR
jgi:general stress protein 26